MIDTHCIWATNYQIELSIIQKSLFPVVLIEI